jgi:hypothetical protein
VCVAVLVAAGLVAAVGVQPRVVAGQGTADRAQASGPAGPTPSPGSSAGPGSTESTADWTTYTDTDAHLRVRLPGQPSSQSQGGGISGTTFTVNFMISRSEDGPIEAGCEDISTPLDTADEQNQTMRVAVASFGASADITKVNEAAVQFRGHHGRRADFTRNGLTFTFLTFFQNDQRLYLLFARSGTPFDTLTSSLVTLP